MKLSNSVSYPLSIGYIETQFYVDTAFDTITYQFLENAAPEGVVASTKDNEIVDPAVMRSYSNCTY